MKARQYYVMVSIPKGDPTKRTPIINELAVIFSLDVSQLSQAMSRGEICVRSLTSLSEAQSMAEKVKSTGALCRVLDNNKQEWGAPKVASNIEKATVLGFSAERAPIPPFTEIQNELLNPDRVNTGRLVNLDGSSADELLPGEIGSSDINCFADDGVKRDQAEKIDVLAKIDSLDDISLEWANVDGTPVPKPLSEIVEGVEDTEVAEEAALELDYETAKLVDSGRWQIERMSAEKPKEDPELIKLAGLTTAAEEELQQRIGRITGSARRIKPPVFLFGGWFRGHMKLRVVCGFVAAVGLASVLPILHAKTVMSTQIEPLRKELSSVKAYGELLSHRPDFKSAEEYEVQISSIKKGAAIGTFAIWLGLSVFFCFLWFRFV
ncbi:MAG: hypothetical protein V1754_10985 [Pseudomonadota bacterium]